ncbi:MAG: hypothetical protein ACRDF5_10620 [bacterium]
MRVATLTRRLMSARSGLAYARALLAEHVTAESAMAAVRARMASREQKFLEMLERTVFGFPDSPYRPLLEAAGYDVPQVRSLVGQVGIEGALRVLGADGVYISIEEFKGLREARRGGRVFRFSEKQFHNPLIRSGLPASSGGTRSGGIATTISVANHRMGTEHLALALAAYGVQDVPVVVWLSSPGASVWGVLAFAAMWNSPPRWFTQLPPRIKGREHTHPYYRAFRAWARLRGLRLPVVDHAPPGEEGKVLHWITQEARGRCLVFTTPSSSLRLALAAQASTTSLQGVTFLTIGEPLTPAKLEAIRRVGARAFSSLGFTEFGRATYGCASPAGPDDTHICRDAVAVIQRRRAADHLGSEVDALLFTTLQPDARRILLNMETGDYATMHERQCGCLLDRLGWTDHLESIRSFEKLNAEGRLFFGSHLITLVEEILPAHFGGDPTDYQLVEAEDEQGFTRLSVLIHPRLGPLDEEEVLERVQRALAPADGTTAAVWSQRGTIRVRRSPPLMTGAGKLMPLHHLGPDGQRAFPN